MNHGHFLANESSICSNSSYCGIEINRLTVKSGLPRGELVICSERNRFRKNSQLRFPFSWEVCCIRCRWIYVTHLYPSSKSVFPWVSYMPEHFYPSPTKRKHTQKTVSPQFFVLYLTNDFYNTMCRNI